MPSGSYTSRKRLRRMKRNAGRLKRFNEQLNKYGLPSVKTLTQADRVRYLLREAIEEKEKESKK